MDIRLDRQNGRNGRTPSELRARHDITGSPTDKSTRSYGFTYVETGKLLRFSAQGDFSQKGILNNGIMATRDNDNTPIQYEACTVSIEKVNDAGKIWFTLQFTDRSDIRIVTEIF